MLAFYSCKHILYGFKNCFHSSRFSWELAAMSWQSINGNLVTLFHGFVKIYPSTVVIQISVMDFAGNRFGIVIITFIIAIIIYAIFVIVVMFIIIIASIVNQCDPENLLLVDPTWSSSWSWLSISVSSSIIVDVKRCSLVSQSFVYFHFFFQSNFL